MEGGLEESTGYLGVWLQGDTARSKPKVVVLDGGPAVHTNDASLNCRISVTPLASGLNTISLFPITGAGET
jgi:hypothetical protein